MARIKEEVRADNEKMNILIVTEVKSLLIQSIKEKLEGTSYQVIITPADTDTIHGLKQHISGVLIYTDEKLVQEQRALNYLKDWAISEDIPIFASGTSEELNLLKIMIPQDMIGHEFLRPINVIDLVDMMDVYLKVYNSKTKKSILVVDDSGAMLRNVKGWLEDKYHVSLANSGTMAIKYLSLNRPDLVLLDYEMPVCDGRQVLEMIRAEVEFADIPVIFLTNKGTKESIMTVRELQPEGYLLKSLEPEQIVKAIDDFFLQRKAYM